jgi:hypothetical protein
MIFLDPSLGAKPRKRKKLYFQPKMMAYSEFRNLAPCAPCGFELRKPTLHP